VRGDKREWIRGGVVRRGGRTLYRVVRHDAGEEPLVRKQVRQRRVARGGEVPPRLVCRREEDQWLALVRVSGGWGHGTRTEAVMTGARFTMTCVCVCVYHLS